MSDNALPQRRTPSQGVHISLGGPNWVFLTVCTQSRIRWLGQISVQRALHDIWLHRATAWLVSEYLLMPDHLHLFCAPCGQYALERDKAPTAVTNNPPVVSVEYPVTHKFVAIERWMAFWKDQLAKRCSDAERFQRSGFHHRLRSSENYSEKWQYVRENPVRAGLVGRPEEWPYQGRVHDIRW